MPDVLIRGVPDHVLAAIDTSARRLGLSRNEFLRRRLASLGAADGGPVTVEDLNRLAVTVADLADPDVMGQAWG